MIKPLTLFSYCLCQLAYTLGQLIQLPLYPYKEIYGNNDRKTKVGDAGVNVFHDITPPIQLTIDD